MSDEPALSLADRLATACSKGDLVSAQAAVADGASVNEKGAVSGWRSAAPLEAATFSGRRDAVAWLLSLNADPNAPSVMCYGVTYSSPEVLQLLIDAGGDVNRESGGFTPLFKAALHDKRDHARLLLALPSLDLTVTSAGKTAEQFASDNGKAVLAEMIAQEVNRGHSLPSFIVSIVTMDG